MTTSWVNLDLILESTYSSQNMHACIPVVHLECDSIHQYLDYVSVTRQYGIISWWHDNVQLNVVLIELIEWWTTKFQAMYFPLYMDLDIIWSMYVYVNVTMDFKSRDRNISNKQSHCLLSTVHTT